MIQLAHVKVRLALPSVDSSQLAMRTCQFSKNNPKTEGQNRQFFASLLSQKVLQLADNIVKRVYGADVALSDGTICIHV